MRRTLILAALSVVLASGGAGAAELFRAGTQDGAKKPASPVDGAKIVDEIKTDLSKAVDELDRNNPGKETHAAQKRVVDNIDRLLNQDDDPPQNPPPSASPPPQSPPSDPPSSRPQPPTPEPKAVAPNGPEPKPSTRGANRPTPTNGGQDVGPRTANELRKEDAAKGRPWGNMPWRPYPGMDLLGRERFPERYQDLLREYYRSLAESGRRD